MFEWIVDKLEDLFSISSIYRNLLESCIEQLFYCFIQIKYFDYKKGTNILDLLGLIVSY